MIKSLVLNLAGKVDAPLAKETDEDERNDVSTTLGTILNIPASLIRCEGIYVGFAATALITAFPFFLIFGWLVPVSLTGRLDSLFRNRRYVTHRQLTLNPAPGVNFFTRGWLYCLAATRKGGRRFSNEPGIDQIDSRSNVNSYPVGLCYVATLSILVFDSAIAASAPIHFATYLHDEVFSQKPEWKMVDATDETCLKGMCSYAETIFLTYLSRSQSTLHRRIYL